MPGPSGLVKPWAVHETGIVSTAIIQILVSRSNAPPFNRKVKKMATKETSPEISSLASRVMRGYDPTIAEVRSMVGSVLSQDETPGQGLAAAEGGKKETSSKISSLASKIMRDLPSDEELRSMAASLLSQDETPGQD